MSVADFAAGLVYRLAEDYQQVDLVDHRTIGIIDNDGRWYLLEVVAADDTPIPLVPTSMAGRDAKTTDQDAAKDLWDRAITQHGGQS